MKSWELIASDSGTIVVPVIVIVLASWWRLASRLQRIESKLELIYQWFAREVLHGHEET